MLTNSAEGVVASTLPAGPGQRNRALFRLARKLKAIPELAEVPPDVLRPIVVEWHRRALPSVRTKEFAASWVDFLVAWGRVKVPADRGAVSLAFRRAVATPPPPSAVKRYDDPAVLLLCGLCRELQRLAGDRPFYLDCRTAGRLIDVSHVYAWKLLTVALVADGILESGAKGSKASKRANEYRYLGD